MRIVYSYHVNQRMSERYVTEAQIIEALRIAPRRTNSHGPVAIATVDGRVLQVGYVQDRYHNTSEQCIVVKTVYWPTPRQLREYQQRERQR